jgi:hypothetical protein
MHILQKLILHMSNGLVVFLDGRFTHLYGVSGRQILAQAACYWYLVQSGLAALWLALAPGQHERLDYFA